MRQIKSLLILLTSFCFCGVSAQQLHTPKEVEQYMKNSTIHYQIDSLTVTVDSISLPLIETGQFLVSNEEGLRIIKKDFPLSKKAKKNRKKARKAVKKNNFLKAQKFYKEAINNSPNHPELLKELIDFYWENEREEEVIFWSKKMIEINPIDFATHVKLALAYQNIGNSEGALEHIIIAHLNNRNHPKIIQLLQGIFLENKMNYQDYIFHPKYQIASIDDKILIQADEAPWRSFAVCKALWQEDEKYQKDMSHFANIPSEQIEAKECLLNALITFNSMKTGKEKFPLLDILGKSLLNGMVDDFILYEIQLREDPLKIHFLSKEKIDRIIRYLKTIRVNREVIEE